ncbi:MAG: FAD-dependent oxidoreductase [Candidatus Tectomicrobia bacterium]|uniref:FAD-dependent oxidoreductase n=1 Tax=Tectimicrobiota bacterium TaxID=2528274 RepID=A0A932I492_UNCTE|nr:FAD-dependent oxidoreductase [Candidatus Tectomicrobia bacterium]
MSIPVELHETDVLIAGGGAAGTLAAFECAEAGVRVIQATKGRATSGTTTVARGGFAAALAPGDSPELHLKEILEHGGELIDPGLARVWVYGIIDVVRDLASWGAEFIRDENERLDLKMFPTHSHPRALHHYDTTGNMVTKVLSRRLRGDARIAQHPHTAIVDLVTEGGRIAGAWGVDYSRGRLVTYAAREIILCTGGGSGLFFVNDNPPQVTGDGYVLGFRAGAPLLGIELIDFQAMCCAPEELFGFAPHPTGFINAGAIFRNRDGEAFLKRYFPETAEQSTRSEVILAMAQEIHAGRAGKTGGIFMDATRVPMEVIQKQIPHVYKTCLSRGIDITKTPLEVAPGSHTWLGGLQIDADGRTPVPGLWAAGETAGGIHGGNRIGGSALSAALVFGRRAGRAASAAARSGAGKAPGRIALPEAERAWVEELIDRREGPLQADVRLRCRMLAHEKLGPIRDARGCAEALEEYERIEREEMPRMRLADEAHASDKAQGQELESALSVRNLALLGRLLATASLRREESRGAHFRLDFPERDDARWRVVTRLERGPVGEIWFSTEPVKEHQPIA